MPKPTVSTTFNAVNKMKGPLAKMGQQVKKFSKFAIAGAGVALGAVAVGVNKFAEAGDEVAKSARKIGLSVEALQELRFAADRSGVSGEAFTNAMKKMNKNVGDLRANTGMLTTYLNKSNPALKEQLQNVETNEEAFALLTTAISDIKNPMDKAALAQAAFGRAGQDLIVMTEDGVEGIEALREEARKYGNIISTEAAASSEKFVDSMTNMKNAGLSLRNKALGPLIDKLQPLIQRMADFIAANDKLINQGIDKTFTAIGTAVRIVSGLWTSGLIPAVLSGVAAFAAITKAIAAYKTILAIAKGIQIAFNFVLSANPIGLIIIVIAALIAGLVLLVVHWDKVKKKILAVWEKIKVPFEKIGQFFGGGKTPQNAASKGNDLFSSDAALLGRNDNVVRSQSTITNQSQLDINMGGFPSGTTAKQTGNIPNMTLNTGFGQAGL